VERRWPAEELAAEIEEASPPDALPSIDRTAKMYVGGRQARPDAEYARRILSPSGRLIGEVGEGNRKDVRNAVEAARKAASSWARATAHLRAQILYYVAENLGARREELARRLQEMTGGPRPTALAEVDLAIERLFAYAAWADKYAGTVQATPLRSFTFAVHEPLGTVGIVCPDAWPLLAFVSTVAPAVAMGNAVVAVPSERWPLAATDLYQVFDTSDVPAGVINIVTGSRDGLAEVLAAHDDLDGLWYFGGADGAAAVERLSAGNLKRTWTSHGRERDWADAVEGEGEPFLRQALQVKNIWVPFGE
jgi:aldehyde dehydrogenase (NAD+)